MVAIPTLLLAYLIMARLGSGFWNVNAGHRADELDHRVAGYPRPVPGVARKEFIEDLG